MEEKSYVQPTEQPLPSQALSGPPAATFVGNFNDVLAIVAATTAVTSGFCCLTFGYGIYCLPLVSLLLGVIALVNAKESIDPERTRRWGWISAGTGGAILLVMIVLAACFTILYAAIIVGALTNPPSPSRFQ